MDPLLMAILGIRSAIQIPLMARNTVLMRLDTALVTSIDRCAKDIGMLAASSLLLFPTQR